MSPAIPTERKAIIVKRFLIGLGCFVLVWILFFDSHSIYSRIQMSMERSRLEESNEALKVRIAELEAELARPLTEEEVERIAREVYGMSREGEKVYPVTEDGQ